MIVLSDTMLNRLRACFLGALSIVVVGCVSVQEQTTDYPASGRAVLVTQNLSISAAKSISFVYQDYFATSRDQTRFDMSYKETDESILISVYSKLEKNDLPAGMINITSGAGNKYGPHLLYHFTKEGTFVDKTGVR